jgi:hypothetical protein
MALYTNSTKPQIFVLTASHWRWVSLANPHCRENANAASSNNIQHNMICCNYQSLVVCSMPVTGGNCHWPINPVEKRNKEEEDTFTVLRTKMNDSSHHVVCLFDF